MKIGLIVAIEMDSIFAYYKDPEPLPAPLGFHVYRALRGSQEIYIIQAGMGEIAASAAVQYACTKYDVDLIVNFGVVGGLSPEMGKRKVCVIDRVVHYKYDCSEFMDLCVGQVDGHDSIYLAPDGNLVGSALKFSDGLVACTCCSGDKFVGTQEEKQYLHDTFEGDVCDMESAGIVLASEMNGVPCLLLKAVSDGLAGGAGEFYEELLGASIDCLTIADSIMEKLGR